MFKGFQYWKKEDLLEAILSYQRRTIAILLLACLGLGWGWYCAPSHLTIYEPPDLSNGVTMKAGTIPKPFIYSFAFQVWQELNYWSHGEPDNQGNYAYKTNLNTYWAYLTPDFRNQLLREYEDLKIFGKLNRSRYLEGIEGGAFNSNDVKVISNGAWEVDLHVRLTEYVHELRVKDIEVVYPLRVVHLNISRQANPYGLALAGFIQTPQRLKTWLNK